MATASLGRLTLDLVARTAGFSEPLSQAERQAKNSGKGIAESMDLASLAVKGLGLAVGGLSVASMVAYSEKVINAGNDIQKFSKLANASVNQFQYYAKGAETAGISFESFADKMKDMQDRIGDFQQTGGGPLADFFTNIAPRVGVTIQQFQKLSGPEALQLFYNSLEKAGASTNDMKFYMEAIISDSSLLIPLLEKNGKGFKFWGDAAQKAGAIMSDDMVKSLSDAKVNLQLMDLQWQGLQARLVNSVIPAIDDVATHMGEIKDVATVLAAYLVGSSVPAVTGYVTSLYTKISATIADINAQEAAILVSQRKAQAELNAANSEMSSARAAVANAEAKVLADRKVIASEIQRIESTIAQINTEKALEAQSLKSQYTDQGRAASISRMATLQKTQALVVAELTALEQKLASTTVAGSAEYVAARTAQTAATERLSAATSKNNIIQATSAKAGFSLLGVLGGPVGLGLTVAAVAASYVLMRDSSKDATDALEDQSLTVDQLREKYQKLTAAQLALKALDASDEIDSQTEKLRSYKSAIQQIIDELNAEGDIRQSGVLKKYLDDLKAGGESAKNAFAELQKQGLVSESNLRLIADLDLKVTKANQSIDKQRLIQDLVRKATDASSQVQKEQTRVVNESAQAWEKLTQKQREYITQIKRDVMRDNYIKTLVGKGFSTDKANAFADAQVNANGENAFKTGLPRPVVDAAIKNFNLKNYSFNKSELEAIAKVQGIAKANNFAQIEGLYGLPVGTLAALVLQESGGNPNAVSPTGAKGLFQTTGIYRKGKDLSTVEKQAAAAAKYIADGYKEFGNFADAITTYNSGVAGLKDYKNGGRSPDKRKEIAGYAPGIQRWLAGVNGKTAVDNSILMPTQADILAQQAIAAQSMKELDDTRKQIDAQYYTESEKLAKDHQDRIEKITQAYTGTKELKTRLGQEDSLYKEQMVKLDVNRQQQLNQLQAFETDRITQAKRYYDEEIRLMQVSTEYLGKDKELRIDLLKRARDEEIAQIQLEQDQQLLSAQSNYMSETEYAIKRYQVELREIEKIRDAKLRAGLLDANRMGQFQSLNQASDNVLQYGQNAAQNYYQNQDPQGFAKWSLQNQYSTEAGGLTGAYNDQVSGINLIQDEEQRNAQLLAAHEQYLQARSALDIKYADDEEKLRAAQLSMNLNYGEQIFGSMTDMLEASGDKQSGIYKAMFAANKAFAIAQSLVSIQQGIAQAAANPFPLNLAAMASVAAATAGIVSNISSVAGVFYDGGYTGHGGKYEPAGIVHRGEVVFSQADIARLGGVGVVESMRLGHKGYADGGIVGDTRVLNMNQSGMDKIQSGVEMNVSVQTLPGTTADVSMNADGSLDVRIRKLAADEANKVFQQEIHNPNSGINKAIKRNYNVAPRRP